MPSKPLCLNPPCGATKLLKNPKSTIVCGELCGQRTVSGRLALALISLLPDVFARECGIFTPVCEFSAKDSFDRISQRPITDRRKPIED